MDGLTFEISRWLGTHLSHAGHRSPGCGSLEKARVVHVYACVWIKMVLSRYSQMDGDLRQGHLIVSMARRKTLTACRLCLLGRVALARRSCAMHAPAELAGYERLGVLLSIVRLF